MDWQLLNVLIAVLAAAVSVMLVMLAWERRQVSGAREFMLMMTAVAEVSVFYIFELSSQTLNPIILWGKFQYIGLVSIPLAWLALALTFSGYERFLTRRNFGFLAVPFIFTLGLVFTNEWHGLIWKTTELDTSGHFPTFLPTYGIGFWIYVGYAYLLLMIGTILLLITAFRSWRVYRWQALAIFLGTSIPWYGNAMVILKIHLIPNLHPLPISFAIGGLILGFGIFRFRMLDLVPVAYDRIVNNLPDNVWVLDKQERILYVNQSGRSLLDDASQDPMGKPASEVFSRLMPYYRTLKARPDATEEMSIEHNFYDVRISPLLDRRGQEQGRVVLVRDITTKRQNDLAQQEQRLFIEALQKSLVLLNSTLDPDKVMQQMLATVWEVVPHDYAHILLLDEDRNMGKVVAQLGYPPDQARALLQTPVNVGRIVAFRQMLVTGKPIALANPGWHPSIVRTSVRSFAGAPIRFDDTIIGFLNLESNDPEAFTPLHLERLGVFADQAASAVKNANLYTHTVRHAEALEERIDQLMIIRSVDRDISNTLDVQKLLILMLDSAIRLSGAEAAFIALETDGDLKIKRVYGAYRDFLETVLSKNEGIVGRVMRAGRAEMVLNVKDDADYTPTIPTTQAQIAIPLMLRQRLIGLLNLETVSPLYFNEDSFRMLEILAGRMAAAIENARLHSSVQQQLDELKGLYEQVSKLEQIKTDMIRVAAHDLGNPLGVVTGYLDFMTGTNELNAETYTVPSRYIKTMRSSAARMNDIVKNILSLERIDKMADADIFKPVDLRTLLSEALVEYQAQWQAKQIEFVYADTGAGSMMIHGDQIQLYEAMSNLISNAIKYTPDKGTVSVLLWREDKFIYFAVSDTGYGIPDDLQKRLFEPFYRAKTDETQAIEGTGLGLHLVKNIIERHQGKMIFKSVYGQGSTFGFKVPEHVSVDKAEQK